MPCVDAAPSPDLPQSAYAPTVLGDIPLAYWRLGDPVGAMTAADEISNVHPGVVKGSVAFGAPSMLTIDPDTAAAFHSATLDCISMGDSADMRFNGTSTFTVEAWIKLDSMTSGANRGILSKLGYMTGEVGYGLHLATTGLAVFRTCDNTNCDTMASPAPLPANEVFYLAATFNAGAGKFFVNGVKTADKTLATTPTNTNANVAIGCRDRVSAVDEYFDGVIDEVAVYSRVLDEAEILQHYQAR